MAGKSVWVLMEKEKEHVNCGWYVHRRGWGYTRSLKLAMKFKTRAEAKSMSMGETPVRVEIP